MMALLLAAAGVALAAAPFSGVDLDNLTDTPIIKQDALFEASGAQLAEVATGLVLEERDGQTVAVLEKGFRLEIELDLPAGSYLLSFRAQAPSRGTDSFWLDVDGERFGGPVTISVGNMNEGRTGFMIDEAGTHRVGLTLREAPGCLLASVVVSSGKVLAAQPAMRPELQGKHPRILFTAEDIPRFRERIADERVKQFYVPPTALTKKPGPYKPGKRNGGSFRGLSNYAFAYLLAPDETLLESILEWLEMATTYPEVGVDLDAEYFMEGVALTYDWLYDEIPEDLRTRVRDTIKRQCDTVFQASLAKRQGGGQAYQQNHYWFAHLSLAMGAAAVYGEVPQADEWLPWVWDRYERVALSFSPDGGFHEGPAYWDYSMPTLYLYTDLYEWCTGLRIPAGDQGLKGQAEFRLHHVHPGLKGSAALEDTIAPGVLPPTRALLWEAKRFQDPVTMGIAHWLSRGRDGDRFTFLSLDETLEAPAVTEKVGLAKYYSDIETVFARTSWDDDATQIAFVSRPMGGHLYAELCAKYGLSGTGHNHPEQNHFVLFGRGELLVGDPGYTYRKETRNHNTVLVDGVGQYGDGQMWPSPNPGRAHITGFVSEGDVTITSGDAKSAYAETLGLTRFERTLVLAGPDLVVIHDRLAAEEPRTFSWLLHHYGDVAAGENVWSILRGNAALTVAPILPASLTGETSSYTPQYVHPTRDNTPDEAEVGLLELQSGPTTETTFLVPLMVRDRWLNAPEPQNASTPTCDAVRVGDTLVAFNKGTGEMTVDLPWGASLTTGARVVVARGLGGENEVVTLPQPE